MTAGCRSLSVLTVLAVAGAAFGLDVTRPGDFVIPTSTNHPAGEQPFHAIDNTASTKYLNFDRLNTGFTVTPSGSGVVRVVTIVTANDAPPRDPTSFLLEGSDNGVDFTVIASGPIAAPADRFAIASSAVFDNSTTYVNYRITFPTIRDFNGANSMQVAEVQLTNAVDITSPEDEVTVTYTKGASSPVGQGVDKLFDNKLGTKFDVLNGNLGPTTVDVRPLAGATIINGLSFFGANDDTAFPGRTPQNVTILGSNNGVDYTEIFTTGLVQAFNNFEDQEYEFANSTSYLQYRIIFDVPQFDTDMQVGDLQLFGTAGEQPPANDLCANAAVLTAGDISGTTSLATGTDITSCGTNDSIDVWYRYTASASGLVEVSTAASSRDTTLAVFTTCNGAAIACDDNGSFAQSVIRFNAVANQSYLVRVALNNGESGAFRLSLNEDPAEHTDVQLGLNYNFNGLVHPGDENDPDNADGYRAISDRGLAVNGNADSIGVGAIVGNTGIIYSVVEEAGELDLVHLGDRNLVDNGNHAFDLKPNGDEIGIQPNWLPNSDQTGPQTSDVSSDALTFTADTRLGVLYQISNGGGFFDLTMTFSDKTSATVQLQGPDWFFDNSPEGPGFGVELQAQLGVFAGTENVDFATTGSSLNVVEAIISTQSLLDGGFGDVTGKELASLTISGRSNTVAGYALIAATVRDGEAGDICTADFNDDGFVNSQDFFDFLTAFFGNQPSADFNDDGLINSQDFFDFLTAFFTGC